jgi:gliding motility-associated-like protein
MKTIFSTILISLLTLPGFSQNLLVDGSFENSSNTQGYFPFQAFTLLEDWYAASKLIADSIYIGSPDLFDDDYKLPQVEPFSFWNVQQGAAEGTKYIGLYVANQYEGFFRLEAVGTQLTQTLEADALYHIEMKVRNMGVANGDNEPELCLPLHYKRVNILLDSDSIMIYNDPNNEISYTSSPIITSLTHEMLQDQLPRRWQHVGSCFKASGGERFLGISMPIGTFQVDPLCVLQDLHWKIFYEFYYNIDDVKLTKLPETIQVQAELCGGRRTKINIHDLAGLPIMQNEIEYEWEDGTVDSINYLSSAGTYQIQAKIDCETIPITLEVNEIKCDPHIFVPNAFTPNFDGHNDALETFIVVDLPVLEYRFSVFDRWGNLVFTTQDSDAVWDGTFRGKVLNTGVYVWLLEYTIDDIEYGITEYQSSGDVMLFKDRDY